MTAKKIGEIYLLKKEIDRGKYSSVWFGVDTHTNQELAFRMLPIARLNDTRKRYLSLEIEAMRSVDSPYIVQLQGMVRSANNVYLVLELCKGGSIGQYLKTKGSIPLHLARRWLLQIVEALITLSEQNIVHRDLKLEKVLLSSQNEEEAEAKLMDFGLMKKLDENNLLLQVQIGLPLYMAPEIFEGKMWTAKVNVWDLGALANRMLGGPLFANLHGIPHHLSMFQTAQEDIAGSNLPDDVKELLSCTLRFDPAQRPTFQEIRNLRFFTGAPAPRVAISLHAEQPVDCTSITDLSVNTSVDYREQVLTLNYRLKEELGKIADIGKDFGHRNSGLVVIAVFLFYAREIEKCIEVALQLQQFYDSSDLEELIDEAKRLRQCGQSTIEIWLKALSNFDLTRYLVQFESGMWAEPCILKEGADILIDEAKTMPDRTEKLRMALCLLHLGKEDERNRLAVAKEEEQAVEWAPIGDSWDQLMESLSTELKAAEQSQIYKN